MPGSGSGAVDRAQRHDAVSARRDKPRIGLALAGGGPLGGIYEVGTLLALDEALEGISLNDLDIYVGVSAGALVASGLANGLSTTQLFQMLVDETAGEPSFRPEIFFRPAVGEYARRLMGMPWVIATELLAAARNPLDASVFRSVAKLNQSVPSGVFDNTAVHEYLRELYAAEGRTNDFRELRKELYCVAVELDTGETVCFGAPGWDHVPISKAVQASAALPGLYRPVDVDGRHFVDGALRKTLHASVALERGAELLICVNPIVSYDADLANARGKGRHDKLADGGMAVVMSQTFRTIIHSRMQVGMGKYEQDFPGQDVVLFEPDSDDPEMFFNNVFSFSGRQHVCKHAYDATRRELLARRETLEPLLARHGVRLRTDVLEAETGKVDRLLASMARRTRTGGRGRHAVLRNLDSTLDELENYLAGQH